MPIDNNIAENAIRPFVVGRKNWLFAGHPRGAAATAAFFSLIETAKANGLELYAYLRYLFENLPHAENDVDYKNLLPQHVDIEVLAAEKCGWGELDDYIAIKNVIGCCELITVKKDYYA